MRRRGWRSLLLVLCATPVGAQQFRVTGHSVIEAFDVRPLVDDSVPVASTIGSGLLRHTTDGYVVRCVSGEAVCRYRRLADAAGAMPVTQDLALAAWGLGRGIRLYARARARAVLVGDEQLWPRGGDHVDVLAAYAEADRGFLRARLGRQWMASGLGFFDFDGAALRVRPRRGLAIEAYGGLGLARGLHEPLTSGEIARQEPFAPTVRPYVFGGQVTWNSLRRGALAAQYHREIRTDLGGLYAERLSADAFLRVGTAVLEGDLNVDLATKAMNEGRVTLRLSPIEHVAASAFVRHHRPFFDLWTIWNAFSPVGFDEGGLRAQWRPGGSGMMVETWSAYRQYEEAGAQPLFGRVRNTGWRVGVAGATPDARWRLHGRYEVEVGFGAAKSEVHLRLGRRVREAGMVTLNAGVFQRLYELREDDGTVWLLGLDGLLPLGARSRIRAEAAMYRHAAAAQASSRDWTQVRGSLALEWAIGTEPAVPAWRAP
jgi:hypothetical protein